MTKPKHVTEKVTLAMAAVFVVLLIAAFNKSDDAQEQSHQTKLDVVEVEKTLTKQVAKVAADLDTHFKVRAVQDKADTERAERTEKTINRIAEKLDIIPLAGGE